MTKSSENAGISVMPTFFSEMEPNRTEPDFDRGREEIFSRWPIEKMLGYILTHPPG
jgi:hypothetical protein